MGLTSSLYTGLSGMNSNQFRIDVIGDNIANSNTTAFKGSRSTFQTQFAQMFSMGTPPSANQGGSNGLEVGLGSTLGATQRNMLQGSTETTGLVSDLAVDGDGFFVVRTPDNRQAYTRDGSFQLNADNCLVTADGYYLQGFGVDDNGNVNPGLLTDMKIPMGQASQARATDSAKFTGNLSADGLIGTHGSTSVSGVLVTDAGGTLASGASNLTDLRTDADPGTNLFAADDIITVSGIKKGGRELPAAQFVVGTDGTTLDDFTGWLNDVMGIDTSAGLAGSPGITTDGATGQVTIAGNAGEANDLTITSACFSSTNPGTGTTIQPFSWTNPTDAVGQSVYTSFTAYDSLGTPVQVNLSIALESKGTGTSTWRFIAESPDNVGAGRFLGDGTITFDANGNITATTGTTVDISRANTGAVSPLSVNLDLSSLSGLSTGTMPSSLVMSEQTGFPPGTLNGYSVSADGTIVGSFSNGLTRTLGQVSLATFSNSAGLTRETNNLYSAGPNSGQAMIAAPASMGTGSILSGALELSNVDLSREFIGLINASTGFSAAGKVITTSNQLLNDLMMLTR